MRIMIRFAKEDSLRFVSHLDLMRAARRLFRRADLPLAFSEGFHPHPILSFAMALPVGSSSDAEYMDLSLSRDMAPEAILNGLNDCCPPGLKILGVWPMDDAAPSQTAAVASAEWKLSFPGMEAAALEAAAARVLEAASVEVEKNNGKKTSVVDIRPGIRSLKAETENGTAVVHAWLDAGSKNNIQPSALAVALLGEASLGKVIIHRERILTAKDLPLEEDPEVLHG